MESSQRSSLRRTTAAELRQAAGRVYDLLDPPLWLVTAADGKARGGFIATFVARASIVGELPRMVLGVAKHHHTWSLIERSRRFALHLIHPHRLDLVWRFGLETGHNKDKLANLEADRTDGGNPLIPDSPGWLDCRVETSMDTGDRTVYVAAVEAADAQAGATPLTVRRLFAEAPAERVRQLDALYARDGRIDAEAIQRWRSQQASSTSSPPETSP
jgi:flavin reductase (DIM6/NTAB) family NADH-FMN oxidoreductase RutF